MKYNNILADFERDLLDLPVEKDDEDDEDDEEPHGVPGREQFKHVVFGPQAWSGYDEAYFPAVRDAVERGEWKIAQEWVVKTAGILRRAAEKLDLTEGLLQ
jgi:hypothetical protein